MRYLAEQEMLVRIREGDPPDGLAAEWEESVRTCRTLPEARLRVLSFLALASRSAIEGGLDAGTSLLLEERFSGQIWEASSDEELLYLARKFTALFAACVKDVREKQTAYSAVTAACLGYLDSHLEEDVSLQELAASVGHAPYYLSRKFARETGVSFSECLREKRLRRAAFLLMYSDLTAAQISDRLHFADPCYFNRCFRRYAGISPGRYRKREQERTT